MCVGMAALVALAVFVGAMIRSSGTLPPSRASIDSHPATPVPVSASGAFTPPEAPTASPATPIQSGGHIAACDPDHVEMIASYLHVGPVILNVAFSNDGDACRLDGSLALEVEDGRGRRLPDVRTNPDAVGVHMVLGAAAGTSVFAWENWCGARARYDLVLTLGPFTSTVQQVDTPDCGDPAYQSQLRSHQGAMLLNDEAPRPRRSD